MSHATQGGQWASPGQAQYEPGSIQAYAASYAQQNQQPQASYAMGPGMEGFQGIGPPAAAGAYTPPYGQVQRPQYMQPSAEPPRPPFGAPPGKHSACLSTSRQGDLMVTAMQSARPGVLHDTGDKGGHSCISIDSRHLPTCPYIAVPLLDRYLKVCS